MREVASALHFYDAVHRRLPPAYTVDADGKPLHSWRTLILPWLDHQALYEKIKLDEPWDSPHNCQFHDTVIAQFNTPTDPAGAGSTKTNYVVVVGDETAFPGSQGIKLHEIPDGVNDTILVLEIEHSDIHWMEPRDLKFDEMDFRIGAPGGVGISVGDYLPGTYAGFGNVSARYLHHDHPPETLKAALTTHDGEPLSIP